MAQKSIASQIRSMSLYLLGGILIVAFLSLAGTLMIRSIFIDYRTTARTTLDAVAVFEDLFEARMAVLKWRTTQGAEFAEAFVDNLAEIHEAEKALAESSVPPAFAEAVTALNEDVLLYQAHFDEMVASRSIYDELDREISELGTGTRENITEIMETAYRDLDPTVAYHAGRIQEALMLGRFYVERFRKTEQPEIMDKAKDHLNQAVELLATLKPQLQDPRRIELANLSNEGLNGYISKANALAEQVVVGKQAEIAMDALGPKMIADVEAQVDQIVERQNILGPRGKNIAFWTVVVITLVSVSIAVLGWRMARGQSKVIVENIEESVNTMTRIAEGDLEAEVKNTDQENELGRMARALEVFKSNGKAALEAAEHEKVMEKERAEAEAERKKLQEAQETKSREAAERDRKEMIENLSSSLGVVVSAASEGDFSKRVDATFEDGELTKLATSVNALVAGVDSGLSETGKALERIAKGDFTRNMEGDFKGAFNQLQTNTNDMISALRTLIQDITGSGVTLAASSAELRDTSDGLSRQAEQNAASLEETSAALEELSASIKQVSSSAAEASKNADVARDTARSSGSVAEEAADAMNRISDASKEIKKVVSVIDDIAFQINLLALNAGVEAARAGDAGRGFSVVASEVRQLAQRASEAAKEIATVMTRSDNAVGEGVAKVSDAKTSLAVIADNVVTIANSVGEISGAINEQVHGIGEITTAVNQIDQSTQKQAASFEEVTAASSILASEAESLKVSTSRFKVGSSGKVVALETQPAKPLAKEMKVAATVGGGDVMDQAGWEEF